MRLVLSALLAFALVGLAGARDDKKPDEKKPDEKPTAADRLKGIQKELQELGAAAQKEFSDAKTDEEKEAIRDKFFAARPKFAEKALAVAAADLKDPGAFDAAMFALNMAGDSPVAEKAADLIAANFADNPRVKGSIPTLGTQGAGGRKLLRAIHDKATDKETKGTSLYHLAAGLLESADYPRGGPALPADKQQAAFKEAEALLKQAAKDYGDVEIAGRAKTQTVAKAVEGQLFFLNNLTVGKVLPDVEVEDLDGKKVKISDYRGKVVALDIWATWCGPCVAMIPHERELVKNLKDKPFVLISLSADDKKETLTAFIEKTPMPWTHWWNGGARGGAVEEYKLRFYPTIYVLDDKGVIRFKHVRGPAMDRAVEELLKGVKAKG